MPKKKVREVGKEGIGGTGDLRDRMRDAYKPGARPAPPEPGLRNPFKKKPKSKPKPRV